MSNPSHGITQFLAGGLASVTAAFGGLGAIDGALGRVVRNYPDESRVLLVVIAVALSFGVILPAVSKRIPDVVLAVGAVFLILAGLRVGWLAVQAEATAERPRVAGSVAVTKDQLRISGTVQASGLQSDEHMLIRVEGRTTRGELAKFHAGRPRSKDDPRGDVSKEEGTPDYYQLIYAARVGPDRDGNLKAPIDTVTLPRRYQRIVLSAEVQGKVDEKKVERPTIRRCDDTTKYWGCALLLVPDP